MLDARSTPEILSFSLVLLCNRIVNLVILFVSVILLNLISIMRELVKHIIPNSYIGLILFSIIQILNISSFIFKCFIP